MTDVEEEGISLQLKTTRFYLKANEQKTILNKTWLELQKGGLIIRDVSILKQNFAQSIEGKSVAF